MRGRWFLAFSALLLLGCAEELCGDGECPDAASQDAEGALDAGPPDAGGADLGPPDLGPPDFGPRPDAGTFSVGPFLNQASCASARAGGQGACNPPCPGSGLCVSTASEQFCVDRCGSDLDGCLDGFACVDIGGSSPLFVCVPPGASCVTPGAAFGTGCAGDPLACAPDRELCQGDVEGFGYCTNRCGEVECPPGYDCGPGDEGEPVCLSRLAAGAERCGTEGREDEAPCLYDGDCAGGPRSICVLGGFAQPGICALPCGAEDTCPGDASCRNLSDGRRACVPERCGCRGLHAEGRDLLAEALLGVELDRCTLLLSPGHFAATSPPVLADPYRLGFTNPLVAEPGRVPSFTRTLIRALESPAAVGLDPTAQVAGMIEVLAQRLDHPAAELPRDPVDLDQPLALALARLVETTNGIPRPEDYQADAQDVPYELQLAVATVLEGMRQAVLQRYQAFERIPVTVQRQLFDFGAAYVAPASNGTAPDPSSAQTQQVFNQLIDYGALFGGSVSLLNAIAEADLPRFRSLASGPPAGPAQFIFAQDSPIGRVVIDDGESGLYDPSLAGFGGLFAFVLDLGGDDVYRIPAGASGGYDNLVSVHIDLGGADDYGYNPVPSPSDGERLPSDGAGRARDLRAELEPFSLSRISRQGVGKVGIGVLVDYGPEGDRYRSLRVSQGVGVFGVGVLIDEGGDDDYEAEAVAQGAALFGVGVQYDGGGRDRRRAYQAAQGFGFARGAGLSYDVSGDDTYELDVGEAGLGGDVLYPSAQRASANASLGQGFAFGRRGDVGDPPDGGFMSGGLGLLLDLGGHDRYRAGLFAQGGGFWWGTGVLADKAGDDQYDSLWYGMGTGAHYAVGVLADGAGSDRYGAQIEGINVTIAGGHDFSAAFLIDDEGDDEYFGSRITLGAGNSNGRGFFVDNAGDDHYRARFSYSMGSAGLLDPNENYRGSPRRRIPSLGVFIDAGGTDVYERMNLPAVGPANDSAWLQTNAATAAVAQRELGVGVDGEGDSTIRGPWSE